MDKDKKEVGGWWIWILFLIVITTALLGIGSYFGIIGKTVVERVVFENSFQYSEARKSELLTFEASLAQIDIMLGRPDLDAEQRRSLNCYPETIGATHDTIFKHKRKIQYRLPWMVESICN